MWNFSQYSNNIAVIAENGEQYSYAYLEAEGETLAKQIGGRCLVFCLCENSIGSLIGYTMCLNHGIVPLLLDANLEGGLLNSLIDTYKPNYICKQTENGYTLEETPYHNVYPLNGELALLLTTSGSTGSPKLVRQSYANIRANTESIAEYLRLEATERSITTLPMSYTYGLSIINSHLWVGASIILTRKTLMQREFWTQFKEYGATNFGGVPYTYEMLDKLSFFRMDLPSLRTMTQAGGKLSPKLHKKFAKHAMSKGKKFVVMYGQTEATARMSYLPAEKSIEKYGSMGIAIPGGEFSLIDIDGNSITEPEAVGELVYKGKNVTLGYAESGDDLIKGDEREGILVTGDMAKRDSDGYYYIVGRKKRFLKIFGSRVNLDETERILRTAFPDIDCACGGVDDKMSVYITYNGSKRDILKYLSEKMGFNQVAFDVVTVNTIPRNDAGKILYNELGSV
jgi:acyl-CoA synthetase (AMP-forming)/AMP-acid ligase II